MKKIAIIALLLGILFAGNSFAAGKGWAIGGSFTFDWAGGNETYVAGAALSIKFPQLPIMFGFSARFIENNSAFGATADWWLFQTHLVGPVSLYIGPGIYFWVLMSGTNQAGFGMRIPIGFQIFIVPAFEIFLEPAVQIGFLPILPSFGLQAALGFRFWF